jgi:hypothetical protein
MVMIIFGPFALSPFDRPLPSPHEHGLYTLGPIKYNIFCLKIYIIKVYSITKIYAIGANVILSSWLHQNSASSLYIFTFTHRHVTHLFVLSIALFPLCSPCSDF